MSPSDTSPRFPVPKGACDCHYHIFGPRGDYPPKEGTVHLMPDALPEDHAAMRARVGLERMVLVQPGSYYSNNYPMLDVLAAEGDKARGIAAYDPFIVDVEVEQLHEQGVRGMRMSPGRNVDEERIQVVWGHIMSLAPRFEPFGWAHSVPALRPSARHVAADAEGRASNRSSSTISACSGRSGSTGTRVSRPSSNCSNTTMSGSRFRARTG